MFQATLKHNLFAHTHAQYWTASTDTVIDHAVAIDFFETVHAGGKRAHTRNDQTVGFQSLTVIGGKCGIDAKVGKSTHHGSYVAKAIIENNRCGHSLS